MQKEITDLLKHDTWELISRADIPKGRKITKSRWCYTIKYNRDGSIARFKSRFVACGYSQIKGIDYDHTFSATMRATSFRMLMAMAAGERLELEHFDVTSAFTQSDIDAEIYVEPPKGFESRDDSGRTKVLKLKKALYGTKQAARLWQHKLRDVLINKMGFTNSTHDPCMFTKRDNSGGVLICGVYVDDVTLAHNGILLEWFKAEFEKHLRSTHLGKLSWFLGMAIDRDDDGVINIHQAKYVEKLLDKFAPTHKSTMYKRSYPCSPTSFQKLTTASDDMEREKVSKLPYREIVGSLLYVSTMTRPDVAYHVSVLCQQMHDPSIAGYEAAIGLLLYLGNTKHYSLTYTGDTSAHTPLTHLSHLITNSAGLMAYSDASWHKPDELGFNMFGYCIYMYGGVICYSSKLLKVIALSSAEAEYAAASSCCKEVVFIRNMCNDLGITISGPTAFAVDNEAAIAIAENHGVTARNKHFADASHYIRHQNDHGVVRLSHVTTDQQRADGFTKTLDKTKHESWAKGLVNTSRH